MQNDINSLMAMAVEHMNERKFADAGKLYEKAAAFKDNREEKAALLKTAAQAYEKARETKAAVRCYLEAGNFLAKTNKAECLMACYSVYIISIAGYAWDCCFEWRGNENHDDDHDLNQMLIKEAREKAEKIFRQALNIEGADKKKIIKMAIRECKKRKRQGGWGEGACWDIVANVTGKKKHR